MAAPPHVVGEGAALGEGAAHPAEQPQRHLELSLPGDAKPGGAYVAVHGRITRSLLQLPYANVPGAWRANRCSSGDWHVRRNLHYIFRGVEARSGT
jgi:hypothetical protein